MKALTGLAAISILIAALGVPVISSAQKSVEEKIESKFAQPPSVSSPKKEAAKEQAASDLDKLAQEWRLTRVNIRYKESILVSVVAIISLAVVLGFMTRKGCQCSGSDIIHASGLVFIIFGTIFLVVIADVDEQLTASIGILGAIAGYLFGRRVAGEAVGQPPPSQGGPPGSGPGAPPTPKPGAPPAPAP